MAIDAFTISSNNYLGMARVFAESYLEHHPGTTVYTCLVDRLSPDVDYADLPFEVIPAEDLAIPDFSVFSFKYDILELNTAVKPFFFKYLRDRLGLDRAFYFDPDIWVLDRLSGLEAALDDHQAVLTPHLTQPTDNRCRPPERVIGMCGVYNLGFVGLQLGPETSAFLDWWCDRLNDFCFVDLANGLFVDQSWMDFAPAYLESTAIVRDPIYNIAYWNLPHRRPVEVGDHWEVDGQPVGFVHFSGVDFGSLNLISRHQDRVDLAARPELRTLFASYEAAVRGSGQDGLSRVPYSYARFAGTDVVVPAIARQALHEVDPEGVRWPDPFDISSEDTFLGWFAQPIPVESGTVNRAALYLWRRDPQLQSVFPKIAGPDLEPFALWFIESGAEEYGLDRVFVDPLAEAAANRRINDWKRLRGISLEEPAREVQWLNEPVDSRSDPVVTRLAAAIHAERPDIQEQFPDLLDRDRADFAYWLCRFGKVEYGLHPDLVEPIVRGLSARNRLSLGLRSRFRSTGDDVEGPRPLIPERATVEYPSVRLGDGRTVSSTREVGVNLVGMFEGIRQLGSFASGLREVLQSGGIPRVCLPMDHDLPEMMTTDRIRFEHGAPYPITVIDLPTDRWPSAVAKLPLGARAGGKVVGYCCEPAAAVRALDLACVDEVWVPTHREAKRIVGISPVPVRPLLPPVGPGRTVDSRALFDLDPGRSWLLVAENGEGEEDSLSVSRALECVRRVTDPAHPGVGLVLLVAPDKLNLVEDLRHLPVHVHDGPVTLDVALDALEECDGLLDLSTHPRLGAVAVEAVLARKPILLGSWLELAEEAPIDEEASESMAIDGSCSAEMIPNAVEAILRFADRQDREPPSPEECERDRTLWRQEAVDQWARELRRILQQ